MDSTTAFEPLLGMRLRRLDGPAPDLLALTLERRGLQQVLVARIRGDRLGVGVVSDRPRGDEATAAITRLRRHLTGATLQRVEQSKNGALLLAWARGDQQVTLELSFAPQQGNAELRESQSGRVLTRLHQSQGHQNRVLPLPQSMEALQAAGLALAHAESTDLSDPETLYLTRAMDRRLRSLTRRQAAIAADQVRAQQAQALREKANLLLANLHHLGEAHGSVEVQDFTTDPAGTRTLVLEADRTPRQQAESWFDRARKLERGAAIARERAQLTQQELIRLTELRARVALARSADERAEIVQQARELGVQGLGEARSSALHSHTRLPYHEFRSLEGYRIWVGRSARDNDTMTLHAARPQDLFLHVRGSSGSHVIIRLGRNETCPTETLLDAATLAQHFSPVRGEGIAEVSYTPKRHVRKPRGAPPGTVLLGQEKVILLRHEPERLRRLLGTKLAH